MAKKKSQLDGEAVTPDVLDDPDGTPPEPVAEDEPPAEVPAPELEPAPEAPPAELVLPEGHVVRDERLYHVWIDGVRHRHVSDAPDGRWVYAKDT